MRSKFYGVICGAAALALFALSGGAFYTAAPQHEFFAPQRAASERANGAINAHTLIVEPRDGIAPVTRLIASATSSIDVVMYQLEDTNIEALLAHKAREGVRIRVILDNGYFGKGSRGNQIAFDYLRSHAIAVEWSPQYFALTHEKSIVVDGRMALIMTFNLVPKYYRTGRDFGIIESDPADVAAMERAFDSDWNSSNFPASRGDDLVWSPGSRTALLDLIAGARTSLKIYNEEMQDTEIVAAISSAAARGIDVAIVMTYSANWKAAFKTLTTAGVHVRTYKRSAPLYIHAKVIIADGARAFVGSENFSSTSLDQNRELGVLLSDASVIAQLTQTFAGDWQGATPFYSRAP